MITPTIEGEFTIPTWNEAHPTPILSICSTLWYAHFVCGKYSSLEVLEEVAEPAWQRVRISMLRRPLEFKWNAMREYLITNNFSHHSRVCVTNYVYALARGGIIR
jgi:hypothetical protein